MVVSRSSPLALLLGAIFFLSANVLAVSAVLGIDLGTEYIKAALVKPGIPLEIVLTKDSRRKETSAVAFKPVGGQPQNGQFPERAYGADAMALSARFPGEVYPNLKTLLGLPTTNAIVQEYAARHPALQLLTHPSRGTAAFKSKTLTPEEEAWMVEELLAMEIQSVQKNAEATAGADTSVRSIVLTVPPFYTTEERRAIQMAADLAGLKVLSLVSDGLAVGLNYATSRQFPNINEGAKPEYHVVFDMGAGSTSATIMRFQSRSVKDIGKFNKTVQEIHVLGSGWDRTLGGDSLNYLIMDDMVKQFVNSKGVQKISATSEGLKSHGRAIAKLGKEAERLRHVLSANQNTQASFEGLYEDVDFKYKITRAEFEAMAEAYPERIGAVINNAVKMSGLDKEDITSVIIHGGATRTPLVREALERIMKSADKIRSNVNADEAAVFGAGFRAAELSPSFRVKEIRISEGAMYQAGVTWTGNNKKVQRQRLWTATSPLGAAAKEMTFTEKNDFTGSFYQQIGSEDKLVKSFVTNNLTATFAAMKEKYPSCAEADIQFKMGIKLRAENGEVTITRAVVECEADVSEKEGFVDGVKNLFGFGKKDQQPLNEETDSADTKKSDGTKKPKKDTKSSSTKSSTKSAKSAKSSKSGKSSTASGTKSEDAAQPSEDAKPEVKKEIVSIPVEITLAKAGVPALSKDKWNKAKDRLKSFAASDKARFQREEALNMLEAYTYKVRDLVEGEEFISRSTEAERDALLEMSRQSSEWLDEDGEKATTNEFRIKLKALQDLVAPIQRRIDEAAKRPELVAALKGALDQTANFVENMRKKIEEYEQWKASSSASSLAATETTASSDPSETPKGDFDGLEDETTAPPAEKAAEDTAKDSDPLPPMYKREDLDEVDALRKSTYDWLNEIVGRQDTLSATADPVLLSSDILARQQKLDKAGLDLALKGVNFGKNAKKAGKSSDKKKKQGKSKTKSAAEPNQTIKFGDGDNPFSEEDLKEAIEKLIKEEKEKEGQKQKEQESGESKHDEL